jgi:hypothetical protein
VGVCQVSCVESTQRRKNQLTSDRHVVHDEDDGRGIDFCLLHLKGRRFTFGALHVGD